MSWICPWPLLFFLKLQNVLQIDQIPFLPLHLCQCCLYSAILNKILAQYEKILQIFCWPSLVSVIVIGAYWRMMITSILQLWHSHLFLQKSQNVCLCSSSLSNEMAYDFEETAFIKNSPTVFFSSTFPSLVSW